MKLKILDLNTQKGYQPSFRGFIQEVLSNQEYDFILLQEVNTKVISLITESKNSYNILNPFDDDLGDNTHVCILYKNSFKLKESSLTSFAKSNPKMPMRGWGFLIGDFEYENKSIIVGSAHLHPGLSRSLRSKEIKIIKNKLLKYKNDTVIFGGDFNTGLPGEIKHLGEILLPEFSRATHGIGKTLQSRYTEKAPFLLNRLAVFLGYFGIGFNFNTDHLYINSPMLPGHKITCNTLPDRVSDHLPIELMIGMLT